MSLFVDRAETLLASASEKAGTVAAGTLALSVTFRTSLVEGAPHAPGFLVAAWIALTVCVVSHIVGLVCQAGLWISVREGTTTLSRWQKALIIVPAVLTWGGFASGMVLFTMFAVMNAKT